MHTTWGERTLKGIPVVLAVCMLVVLLRGLNFIFLCSYALPQALCFNEQHRCQFELQRGLLVRAFERNRSGIAMSYVQSFPEKHQFNSAVQVCIAHTSCIITGPLSDSMMRAVD